MALSMARRPETVKPLDVNRVSTRARVNDSVASRNTVHPEARVFAVLTTKSISARPAPPGFMDLGYTREEWSREASVALEDLHERAPGHVGLDQKVVHLDEPESRPRQGDGREYVVRAAVATSDRSLTRPMRMATSKLLRTKSTL